MPPREFSPRCLVAGERKMFKHTQLPPTATAVEPYLLLLKRIFYLFVFGLAALRGSIAVYIGPSAREREKIRERIV